MVRYSQLAPLTIDEQIKFAISAMDFFSVLKNRQYREILNLPVEETIRPLSFKNFLAYWEKINKVKIDMKQARLSELFSVFTSKKLLQEQGVMPGLLPYSQCYYNFIELTNIEQKGILFLGKYLGLELISHLIKKNLVHIIGENRNGGIVSGTGILISPKVVLTCAHVISDIHSSLSAEVNAEKYTIEESEIHPHIDFGVIILSTPILDINYDIALRNSTILEKIIIAGFPKIPRNLNPCIIVQSGEIAGRINSYGENSHQIELELFTAVSRPGNSGGPVMSMDGKLLGIVSQSLELNTKDVEQSTFPCFAAIPADIIMKNYAELKLSSKYQIPWENYQ